jgi:hypothetical protein
MVQFLLQTKNRGAEFIESRSVARFVSEADAASITSSG